MKNKRQDYAAYAVAFVVAIIAGWHWRKPNADAIDIMYRAKSQWKQELLLDKLRAENIGLFWNDYFDFNIPGAILAWIGAYLIFLYIAKEKKWLQD